MTLAVNITRVTALVPNRVFLQWDLTAPTESGSYTMEIYRSGSSEGPWTLLHTGTDLYYYFDAMPTTAPSGQDEEPNLLALLRDIYYRVVVTPPSGAVNKVEAVSSFEPGLEPRMRGVKRKIQRDISVQLRILNGVEVALLKRKHWGARCTVCYDKYTKTSMRENCLTCYGTTFTGGYATPIITHARFTPRHVQTAVTPQGIVDSHGVAAWLLDVPLLRERDVIIGLRDNRRFLVKEVMQTEIRTVAVHQKLVLSELAKTDVVFKVQVDPYRTPRLF